MYERTRQQMVEITLEAERRVRAGEPRAEVARALDIPISTLAHWAHRGGWRRKDLVAVRNEARGRVAREQIARITAAEHEQHAADAAKMREAIEASEAELAAIAPGGQLPGAMGEGPVPAPKLAMAMADTLLRQGRLDEADRAVRLAIRFAEAGEAALAREETKLREERERATKWWVEKQGAYHKLHQATLTMLDQMQASLVLELSRSAEDCCPKCGRRMDFWPEEIERPDDEETGGDSNLDDSGSRDSKLDDSGAGDSRLDDSDLDDSGAGDSNLDDSGKSGDGRPRWKKDADGDWYWDGPPE